MYASGACDKVPGGVHHSSKCTSRRELSNGMWVCGAAESLGGARSAGADLVLKMDCEACEWDALCETSDVLVMELLGPSVEDLCASLPSASLPTQDRPRARAWGHNSRAHAEPAPATHSAQL